MLRITELRLPLDHADDALRPAIVARLGLRDTELTAFTVFKRSYDARKKTAIVLIYTVDCQLAVDESAVLARFAGDAHVKPLRAHRGDRHQRYPHHQIEIIPDPGCGRCQRCAGGFEIIR